MEQERIAAAVVEGFVADNKTVVVLHSPASEAVVVVRHTSVPASEVAALAAA